MSGGTEVCPGCGATHGARECPRCAALQRGMRVLAGSVAESSMASAPGRHARLIREFKGPALHDLLDDPVELALMPGRVQRALDAIERGDLREADDRLDAAIGAVLEGPGFGRRGEWHMLLPVLLCLFAVLAVTTLVVLA